jgi:hypothetical protein
MNSLKIKFKPSSMVGDYNLSKNRGNLINISFRQNKIYIILLFNWDDKNNKFSFNFIVAAL